MSVASVHCREIEVSGGERFVLEDNGFQEDIREDYEVAIVKGRVERGLGGPGSASWEEYRCANGCLGAEDGSMKVCHSVHGNLSQKAKG